MNPNAPKPSAALPSPPEWLSGRASEWFQKTVATLVGMGIASADHADMLSVAAARFDEILDLTAVIEDSGRVYHATTMSGDVVPKARPEVAMRNEALRHFQSLLSEFGLSPSAVGKVSSRGQDADANPYAEFG